jgi:hypothetical protein
VSDNLRKQELECLRMEADCLQLAGDVKNPDLQAHFIRMAKQWSLLAERDSVVVAEIEILHEAMDGIAQPTHARRRSAASY